MSTTFQESRRSRSYQRITLEARLKLISLVSEQKLSILKAAERLKIALSTAKLIIKRYRDTGTVFMRENEKKKNKRSGLDMKKVKISSPTNIEIISEVNESPQEITQPDAQIAIAQPAFPQIMMYYGQPFIPFTNYGFWSFY